MTTAFAPDWPSRTRSSPSARTTVSRRGSRNAPASRPSTTAATRWPRTISACPTSASSAAPRSSRASAACAPATDLPIVVDADTGYGSEAGVWLTTRELEAAGANAVQIEDQVSPKRCGHMEGKEVIPADEMVIKVRAAVAARRSDETLIIARSDALQVTGLDDAIARCNAYADAGADLVFVDAPPDRRGVRGDRRALLRARCREHVRDGSLARRSRPPSWRSMGYKLVIFPSTQTWLFAKAYEELCEAVVRDRTTAALADRFTSFDDVNALLGLAEWQSR